MSVKSSVLKNPTDAVIPDTGVGCVLPETGTAITYPKSSSGPSQNCGLFVNPEVGVPTAKVPTCVVPAIAEPVLYANGLDVDIFYLIILDNIFFNIQLLLPI